MFTVVNSYGSSAIDCRDMWRHRNLLLVVLPDPGQREWLEGLAARAAKALWGGCGAS